MKKQRIVIYGIGNRGQLFLKFSDKRNIEIVGIVDLNKAGTIFQGIEVSSPSELLNMHYDKVVVTPYHNEDILRYLMETCGIKKEKIVVGIEIEKEFILNRISEYKYVLFIDEEDYLEYLYHELGEAESFVMLDLLNDKEKWEFTGKTDLTEHIFIFGIYDYITYNNNGFFQYLKQGFPNSKTVMILYDICDGANGFETIIPGFSVERLKSEFDLVITYHSQEAKKHNLMYMMYPYPQSKQMSQDKNIVSDILFVGQAKDRLSLLHEIYIRATEMELKCHFFIVGVNKEEQLVESDIIYNTRISYQEYLKEVLSTRCILEICQQGDETSFRYLEAVIFNKRLLLNDKNAIHLEYYKPDNIQIFDGVDDIDFSLIKEDKVDYNYQGDYEPRKFIDFLDAYFMK
mgnify:CR=1 FL=1